MLETQRTTARSCAISGSHLLRPCIASCSLSAPPCSLNAPSCSFDTPPCSLITPSLRPFAPSVLPLKRPCSLFRPGRATPNPKFGVYINIYIESLSFKYVAPLYCSCAKARFVDLVPLYSPMLAACSLTRLLCSLVLARCFPLLPVLPLCFLVFPCCSYLLFYPSNLKRTNTLSVLLKKPFRTSLALLNSCFQSYTKL